MYFNFDLSQAFYFVTLGDYIFSPHNGQEVCLMKLKSKDETRSTMFHLVKMGDLYKMAELVDYDEDDENPDIIHNEEFRHPSLLVQQYHLPANIPMEKYFLGPFAEMQMLRILKLAQASLSRDHDMMEEVLWGLNYSFAEPERPKQATNVLRFNPRPQ